MIYHKFETEIWIYSASLNKSIFLFRICDISLPQDQTGSVYFLMSQKDTSYFHIRSTLCLRTTLRKYNAGGYVSDTDTAMYLSLVVSDLLHLLF